MAQLPEAKALELDAAVIGSGLAWCPRTCLLAVEVAFADGFGVRIIEPWRHEVRAYRPLLAACAENASATKPQGLLRVSSDLQELADVSITYRSYPTPLRHLTWLPQTYGLLAVALEGAAFQLTPSRPGSPGSSGAITLSNWSAQPVWQSREAPGAGPRCCIRPQTVQ